MTNTPTPPLSPAPDLTPRTAPDSPDPQAADLACVKIAPLSKLSTDTLQRLFKDEPEVATLANRKPRATGRLLAILIGGVMTASIVAQDRPITIALAATSSTPAAFLLETFPKVGCSNISIILDESKADYILEAHGGDFEGGKGSEGAHGPRPPQPKARYTLFQNGTAVFGTTPVKEKNAVKDVCKFLQHGSSK